MSQIGLSRIVLCGRRKNINYFHFQLNKWHFHFPIWSERRKVFEKMSENRAEWTVFYEKRKTIINLYSNR